MLRPSLGRHDGGYDDTELNDVQPNAQHYGT
jgi:hypothetical protein